MIQLFPVNLDLGWGAYFLDITPQELQAIKEKKKRMNWTSSRSKTSAFWETWKGKTTDWEKISADQLSAKGLVLIIYKELSKLNKKTNTHVRKW